MEANPQVTLPNFSKAAFALAFRAPARGEEGNEDTGDETLDRAAAPRATGRMDPKDWGSEPGAGAHMACQKLPSAEASSELR